MEKNYKNKILQEIMDLENVYCDAEEYYLFAEEYLACLVDDVLNTDYQKDNAELLDKIYDKLNSLLRNLNCHYYYFTEEEFRNIICSLVNSELNLEKIEIDFALLEKQAKNREKSYEKERIAKLKLEEKEKKEEFISYFNKWKKRIDNLLKKTGMEIVHYENERFEELIEIYDFVSSGKSIEEVLNNKKYYLENIIEAMKDYSYETKEYKNHKLYDNKKILYIK